MPSLRIKRGTLAQLDAAATASGLKQGEQYLVTDYGGRVAIGLSASTYKIEPRIYTQSTSPTDAIAGDIWIETP